MTKKSLIFGIGVGILLMALISLGAYMIQRNSHRNNLADLRATLDATTDELIIALDTQAPQINIGLDDNVIITRARELGMIFADEIEMPIVPESNEGEIDSDSASNGETQSAQVDTTIDGDYVWVNIPLHANSTQISELLQDSGVVVSANDFNQFLVENGYDRIVQAGNFRLPVGGDFDVIIDIILIFR